MEIKKLYCISCKDETKHVSKSHPHLLYFFMTIFSLGLFLPIWALTAVASNPYHCDCCGEKSKGWSKSRYEAKHSINNA